MNDRWQQFLASRGATRDAAGSTRFPAQQPAAGARLADLSHLTLIAVEGRDAADFLHNQFTSDVTGLATGQWQWSGYCNAKGRLLATLRLMRDGDRYLAEVPGPLATDLIARLRKYVLRAQVKFHLLDEEYVGIGLTGPDAGATLTGVLGPLAPGQYALASVAGGWIVGVGADRWHCYLTPDAAMAAWVRMATVAIPTDTDEWMRFDVTEGIPWILPATRELFTPQMVGLERIGGVSFTKGCYPGQEIVARSQYLGTVKRRLHLARAPAALDPGALLEGTAPTGQTAGNVVASAPAGDGGFRVLAVIDSETAAEGNVSAPASGTRLAALKRVHD
jgi:tRNA-modifying protein YgfZ